MRWGEDDTVRFVKLFLSQDCLWNSKHAHYRLRHVRMKALQNIADGFRASSGIALNKVDVRSKIRVLRSTYYQELSKIRERSRPDSVYKSTIKWFYLWHKHFKTISRMQGDADTQYEDDSEEPLTKSSEKLWVSTEEEHENEDSHAVPIIADPSDNDYEVMLKIEPEDDTNVKKERKSPYKIKRNKLRNSGNNLESILGSDKEDEFDIYGKYIASQLRKMDTHKALRLQVEIQALVSEARISDLSDNNMSND